MQAWQTDRPAARLTLTDRIRSEAGVSLIEVLIAVAILSVGLLAMAKMQGIAMTTNVNTDFTNEAAFLAQTRIEEISKVRYQDVNTLAGTETVQQDWQEGREGFSYTIQTNVGPEQFAPHDSTGAGDGYRVVTVTVTHNWKGPKLFQLSTVKSAAEDE